MPDMRSIPPPERFRRRFTSPPPSNETSRAPIPAALCIRATTIQIVKHWNVESAWSKEAKPQRLLAVARPQQWRCFTRSRREITSSPIPTLTTAHRDCFAKFFLRWGLEADFVDMSNLDEVRRALRSKTKLAWVETPSNPLLKIVDIAAVAEIIHNAGALCICDNTWAPVLQRPFDLGADIILHSTTKYFGGHCDVAGGIVIARVDNEFFQRVHTIQYSGGAVPSPFDCWLILRGMRTLPWRMRAHSENAIRVAEFLQQHPRVERVHYPGLQSHPGYELAKRQMSMFGGMLSFEVTGSREAAMNVAAKTKIFIRATSLGGVESLIEHRASIEGAGTTSPQNLLRLSIGLENADDLIEDLNQALA